jgi:predicted RNase H-like nuclease (RuvC/YqgF family)
MIVSDRMPNYKLEQLRIKKDISRHRSTIDSNTFRIAELSEEVQKLEDNTEGLTAEIEKLEGQLAGLIDEHGQANTKGE